MSETGVRTRDIQDILGCATRPHLIPVLFPIRTVSLDLSQMQHHVCTRPTVTRRERARFILLFMSDEDSFDDIMLLNRERLSER
jgi:hypothetical protein